MLGPTDRIRNEGRRSPKAAKHFRPGASLLPLRIRFPSSSTPAFSHFWINRTTRRSATRCSTNFTSHSWESPSKKPLDVQIEHPVHFSRQQSRVERIQRLMLAAPWPEPIREAEKIRFVDGVQHLDRRTLDDLVFQRRDPERSLPPVGLRDIHPTHRLCSVRSTLQPCGKVLEIPFQFLPVVPPRLPVHARRGFLLQV